MSIYIFNKSLFELLFSFFNRDFIYHHKESLCVKSDMVFPLSVLMNHFYQLLEFAGFQNYKLAVEESLFVGRQM